MMDNAQPSNEAKPIKDDEVSALELINLLTRHVWQILFISLAVAFVAGFYLSHVTPLYRATASLQIGTQQNNLLQISDVLPLNTSSKEELETQYQLLKSRQFAERVIDELRLERKPEFSHRQPSAMQGMIATLTGSEPKTSAISRRELVAMFQSRLHIQPVASTELVKISFDAHTPQLAAIVANEVGATYIEYQNELRAAASESTTQWLMSRMVALKQNLEQSEINLQDFREQKDIVDLRGVVGLVSKQLTELTSQSMLAEKERGDAEVLASIIDESGKDVTALLKLPEIYNHGTIQTSLAIEANLERQLSEVSGRYGPSHPKRMALAAQLEEVQADTIEQIEQLVNGIEQQLQLLIAKEKAINTRLELTKQDYQRLSRLNTEFEQLVREVKTNEQLYQTFLTRLKETDAMSDFEQNLNVRFIDRAMTPEAPFKPKKLLTLIVVLAASLIATTAFYLLKELLKDTLGTRDQLDRIVKEPVLAALPKLNGRYRKATLVDLKREHQFVEAVNTLRTSLMFKHDDNPPKVIALTSSVPNEGKSTVAINLARSFSDMEKVLLIDADLRHPAIAKAFDLDKNRPGLSNLLAKTHQITDCVVRNEDPAMDILPSGICPSNPLAFLSMKRFQVLLRVLGNFYDRIIIEAPPVHSVSDAIVVSRMVDSVLYVVNGQQTRREQIVAGIERLHQVHAPLEGIVLNKSDETGTFRYYGGYRDIKSNIIPLPLRAKSAKRH